MFLVTCEGQNYPGQFSIPREQLSFWESLMLAAIYNQFGLENFVDERHSVVQVLNGIGVLFRLVLS